MKKFECTVFQHELDDVRTMLRARFELGQDVLNLALSPSDNYLAAACADGTVRVLNLLNNQTLAEVSCFEEEKLPAMSVRWFPNEEKHLLVAVNASGLVTLANAQTGTVQGRIQEKGNYTNCVDVNPKGTVFATCGKDCVVRLYDTEKREEASRLEGVDWHKSGHNNRLFCVRFVDENRVISGGWDQNVHLWDIRTRTSTGCICGPKICGDSIDFKQQTVLTGAHRADLPLQTWDYGSQKLISQFQWGKEKSGAFVFGCRLGYQLEQTIFAVASGVNEAKVLSTLEKHKELAVARFSKTPFCVDLSRTGGRWAVGLQEGGVAVLESRSSKQTLFEDDL